MWYLTLPSTASSGMSDGSLEDTQEVQWYDGGYDGGYNGGYNGTMVGMMVGTMVV